MKRNPLTEIHEGQVVVSGACIVGKPDAGAGITVELTPAQAGLLVNVSNLQGVAISAAAPSEGDALIYDTTNGWQPEAAAGGGGYWLQGTGYLYPATAGDSIRVGDSGLSFVSDTNTSLRRSASDTIEIVTGNVVRATVNNTGVTIPTLSVTTLNIAKILPTGGTSSSPEFSKESDPNTGVHLAGGDVLELVTGSVVRATVNNTGVTIPTLSVTTLNIDKVQPTGGTSSAPEFSKTTDPNTGVHLAGGDVLEIVAGSNPVVSVIPNSVTLGLDTLDKVAFFGGTPVNRQAEITDELADNLTTITHTSPVTPDYSIQDLTDSGGFGFATKDEGNTILAQIRELQLQVKNLRTRNIQLENTLVAYNLIPDAD